MDCRSAAAVVAAQKEDLLGAIAIRAGARQLEIARVRDQLRGGADLEPVLALGDLDVLLNTLEVRVRVVFGQAEGLKGLRRGGRAVQLVVNFALLGLADNG